MPRAAFDETLVHVADIPDELLLDIGEAACERIASPTCHEPITYEDSHLTSRERALMSYISHGWSEQYVAQKFGAHVQLIMNRLDNVEGKFGIRDKAGVVGAVIATHQINIEVKPEPETIRTLNDMDLFLLESFRRGISNGKLARSLGWTTSRVKESTKELNGKMKGRGRVHNVRRGYEIGLFPLS